MCNMVNFRNTLCSEKANHLYYHAIYIISFYLGLRTFSLLYVIIYTGKDFCLFYSVNDGLLVVFY